MKLENDPSPARKSYNPFDSDDDSLESPGLKSVNMFVSDSVIFRMDNGDFLWEEAILGEPASGDHSVDVNGNTQGQQPYTDKKVTECELPEFVVCYKESNVKDIGIDEGVHNSSVFLDLSNVKIQESVVAPPHLVNVDELNEETLTGKYLVHEFGDDDLLKITHLKLDIEDRALQGGLVSDHHLVSEKETQTSPSKHDKPGKDLLNHEDDAIEKKGQEANQGEVDKAAVIQDSPTTQSAYRLSTQHGIQVMPEEHVESRNKEETSGNLTVNATMQGPTDTEDSNKMAYNSKVESRTITFNFGSSTNSKHEKQEDEVKEPEAAKAPTTQSMTRKEDEERIPENSILLAKLEQRVHGETSFSSGMPLPLPSSLITYSEPLTYSGSLSLRSESSAGTTSTRSFAFPVLHTDWNSSPTRMGKASHKHVKKHRGWIQALSCCKF